MKIYAVSDLHVDYPANKQWLDALSLVDYQDDILILPGDVTDNLILLGEVFSQLKKRFSQVMYVPGNHDLWVTRGGTGTSLNKAEQVLALAHREGVLTEPWSYENLTIVPLLSWYDYSFGEPSDWLRRSWMDYHLCNWEEFHDEASAVTDFFLAKNERFFPVENRQIISFSHFLPRIDLMPDHIPTEHRRIYPVLGSVRLDKQIRQLGSYLHVYGHSHVNREVNIDGISYINNAFGNPRETRIAKKALKCIYQFSH
ncbi:MAG: metallophosphoesterase [Gammaproteobacteria bacterium]|nr:metallophosphoesterase [Gammaproteobacteria bacterium]